MHLFRGGVGEEGESADGVVAERRGELAKQVADAVWIEHGLRLADADAGGGQSQSDAAGVVTIAVAPYVALIDEPVDGDGHGGGGDAHVRGEAGESGGADVVEVVEDADLMGAEESPGAGVADVAGVAGEEDARVELHKLRRGGVDFHARSIAHII